MDWPTFKRIVVIFTMRCRAVDERGVIGTKRASMAYSGSTTLSRCALARGGDVIKLARRDAQPGDVQHE
jgi:hypothetical protein